MMGQIDHSWNGFYATAYEKIIQQREEQKKKEVDATPLVSVCITHYNRPQFLEFALKSIEKQSYTNFEVILVDDGSTSQEAKEYVFIGLRYLVCYIN